MGNTFTLENPGDAFASPQQEAVITSPWQHRDIRLRTNPSQQVPQECWAQGAVVGQPAVFLGSEAKEARTLEQLLGEGDRFRDGSLLGETGATPSWPTKGITASPPMKRGRRSSTRSLPGR